MRIHALLLLTALLSAQAPAPEQASALERAVVQEMSDARVMPKAYAKHLRALRGHFDGTLWRLPGEVPLQTQEGAAALDEAIAFLETTRPMGPLRFNEGLSRSARDHARDLGPKGAMGHRGTDGSTLSDRLGRWGRIESTAGENISYGEGKARMIVIQLLVDDGVQGRGHRQNIFNPSFHAAGAALGPHKEYGTMCVVDYADGFLEGR